MGGISALQQAHIAEQNLGLQRDVFNYQRTLQNRIFGREDDAVQRRVRDLKAARLSPVLAAGSAARAGAPISVTAPQRSMAGAQQLAQVPDMVTRVGEGLERLRFASETHSDRVRQLFNQAGLTNAQWNIAHQQGLQEEVNALFVRALKDHITGSMDVEQYVTQPDGSVRVQKPHWLEDNPLVVEYLTNSALKQIKETDADFWQALKGTEMAGRIGGMIIQLLLRAGR